jgi:hypothetical protein
MRPHFSIDSIKQAFDRQRSNSILLDEFYNETLDCDTSCLGHDERSEKRVSQCVL